MWKNWLSSQRKLLETLALLEREMCLFRKEKKPWLLACYCLTDYSALLDTFRIAHAKRTERRSQAALPLYNLLAFVV